ncbi:unnamed protein product (macronuclear) [Paramecium tetraurelia]|uniref:Uncharacterized protein n=1 Tax=Paramecium tetraurelia TaxID=5888 RepID=A0DV07_PARTE|nr:uncharacterized protein GSPATT00020536001 [Paramecium tetraurelia]CAK86874.1 unnamed protein product [Paramecium tetraurelia]|eukprot:XP_001454271.1 hypothetical protein (macronuclear) [Paramecium tetraurelia strain d4-2]
MYKLALCTLLILSVTAIDVTNSVWTSHDQKAFAQIKQSGWGNFILNFGELHLQTGGILSELNTEIAKLIDELDEELAEIHHQYARRTDIHNREVQRLEQEIQDKEREVFNAHDFYDNVLIPQRDRFAAQLEQLQENIAQNRRTLNEATVQRAKDHAEFEAQVAEHNEAIGAIDESLQLLSQLESPSLVQIQKVQKNLTKIEQSLKRHSTFQTFIKTLLEIAVEANFADQGALKEILTAFNNLRVQLVDSLNQLTADEAEAQKDFEARVIQLNSEHAEFQRAVIVKTAEIEANANKIEQTLDLIDVLHADLDTLNGQLQAENDDYAFATDVYNATVAEYNKELNAAHQALDLLNQPRFTDYVKSQLKGAF